MNTPETPSPETPTPTTDDVTRDWAARMAARHADLARKFQDSSRALFTELAQTHAVLLTFEYCGSGDEGGIEDRFVFDKDNQPVTLDPALVEEAETIAWNALESMHSGWENNDGASGTITLNVLTRQITISHEDYYTESNHTETVL